MNSYRSHISQYKRNQLLKCFIDEVVATQAAISCGVDRNTANHWYRYFRQCIFDHQTKLRRLSGEVEIDQSFFGATGPRRFKLVDGKKVLLKRQKFLIIGFLERRVDGVHIVRTYHIKKADSRTILPLVYLVIEPGSRVYTDSWRSYNPLGDNGYVHRSINHRKKQYVKKEGDFLIHTGTIDKYFGSAKDRLIKFCRLHPTTLDLHLKECEFRYNNKKDLKTTLKAILRP